MRALAVPVLGDKGVNVVNEIDSVNSGGSVQLESIVSVSQALGALDSSPESELVMTM